MTWSPHDRFMKFLCECCRAATQLEHYEHEDVYVCETCRDILAAEQEDQDARDNKRTA